MVFMLVNDKAKQCEKLHPSRIYLDNFSTYKIFSYTCEKLKAVYFDVATQVLHPPTIRYDTVSLNVGSTIKILITSSAYQNLKRWGSASYKIRDWDYIVYTKDG